MVDEIIRLISNGHFILARVDARNLFRQGLITENNFQVIELAIWEKELEKDVLIKRNTIVNHDEQIRKFNDLFMQGVLKTQEAA